MTILNKTSSKNNFSAPMGSSHKIMTIHQNMCECPACGLFQEIPQLNPGQVMVCTRCSQPLGGRKKNLLIATPLAFCVSSFLLYLITISSSLMTLNVYGRERTADLITGPMELIHEGLGAVGMLVAFVTILLPGIAICVMASILYGVNQKEIPLWTGKLLVWYRKLRPWSMIEVYILGIFVAYTKLTEMAYVHIGYAIYSLCMLMITMSITDVSLDELYIWRKRKIDSSTRDGQGFPVRVIHSSERENTENNNKDHTRFSTHSLFSCRSCGLVGELSEEVSYDQKIGQCPRCHSSLSFRKSNSLSATTALLLAALILYIPANLYPVMTFVKLGQGGGRTIIAGAIELWQNGMIPLSLLVFFASITVPVLKIFGLGTMVITAWRQSSLYLKGLSHLFRIIDFIGRWSMIDVFMISILVAVVRFNKLTNVTANVGVFAFAAVVVLTIFAVHCFDPRVMWDASGQNSAAIKKRFENRMKQNLPFAPSHLRKADQA